MYIKYVLYRRVYIFLPSKNTSILYVHIPWNIYGIFTYVWSTYYINFHLNIYDLLRNWQIANLNLAKCIFLRQILKKMYFLNAAAIDRKCKTQRILRAFSSWNAELIMEIITLGIHFLSIARDLSYCWQIFQNKIGFHMHTKYLSV